MSDNDSAMGNYEMELIRHLVDKAIKESDRIDGTELTREEVETALWGAAGDIALGAVITDPDKRDLFEHYDPEDNDD